MSSTKPHPPPPMYPMYPTDHKPVKPKPKKEGRQCLCFGKRHRRKSVAEVVKKKVNKLEFWTVYGGPYLLIVFGLLNSILSAALALAFRHDCPALPLLIPVLLGRLPLGAIDGVCFFLMTAEVFKLDKSYDWVRRITDKLCWRTMSGVVLAHLIVWTTLLHNATDYRYNLGIPISKNSESPQYCHQFLYQYARINSLVVRLIFGVIVALFFGGSVILLFLLCIVARIE